MSWLLPFQLPFMQDAFVVTLLVAVPCGLLSAFLVLKGWSLIGDAISHAVLPGVVLAYIMGLPLIVGAFAAGMGSALLTGWLDTHSRIKRDTLMGVVFSAMFAIGIVMISKIQTGVHLDHILFGNMLGLSRADLWTSGLIGAGITGIISVLWRDMMLHAFDEAQARAVGLPVAWLHHGLLAMISAAVVAALSAVGLILVIALLITPGAIAFLITKKFGKMLLLSGLIAALAGAAGVYLSFWIDSAPAPTIVVILTATFVVTLLNHLRIRRKSEARA